MPLVVTHYNVQPVTDLFAANQDRDLGAVMDDVYRILKDMKKDVSSSFQLPRSKRKRTWVTLLPSLPSTLLERRPDVAALEYQAKISQCEAH
jgi:hypothetical protein